MSCFFLNTVVGFAENICFNSTQYKEVESLRKEGYAESLGWHPGDSLINVPASVKVIPAFAFADISELRVVRFDDNSRISSIGSYAFLGCSNIETIALPSSLKSLEEGCFRDCISLSEITIPNSITNIPAQAFRGCTKLRKVLLSPNIVKISAFAFIYCESLEEISFPSKLRTIGNNAFSRCLRLKEIVLPPTLTHLDSYAFSDCISLQRATLPGNSSLLGELIFSGCASLEEITEPSVRVPKFDCNSYIFEPTDTAAYRRCQLIVPERSIDAYRKSPSWGLFENILFPAQKPLLIYM
ncbi:MAG: leucine-rich repeat domain-containing protein [Clostridium sp.]|nr:leucine-rich repeat domain-containing protein [Prevotella sp.]MCM1429108.1 leucine-rich repeat domain-containing protein [Clostridium sp.]MCM1475363.1 leucine-rich repeat domain-containing protein [Muribaculaceae bacterium]